MLATAPATRLSVHRRDVNSVSKSMQTSTVSAHAIDGDNEGDGYEEAATANAAAANADSSSEDSLSPFSQQIVVEFADLTRHMRAHAGRVPGRSAGPIEKSSPSYRSSVVSAASIAATGDTRSRSERHTRFALPAHKSGGSTASPGAGSTQLDISSDSSGDVHMTSPLPSPTATAAVAATVAAADAALVRSRGGRDGDRFPSPYRRSVDEASPSEPCTPIDGLKAELQKQLGAMRHSTQQHTGDALNRSLNDSSDRVLQLLRVRS
jgi:hypothetical protein